MNKKLKYLIILCLILVVLSISAYFIARQFNQIKDNDSIQSGIYEEVVKEEKEEVEYIRDYFYKRSSFLDDYMKEYVDGVMEELNKTEFIVSVDMENGYIAQWKTQCYMLKS